MLPFPQATSIQFPEKPEKARKINTSRHKKSPADHPAGVIEQSYKDSNLEMTESESVALPFGDSPLFSANVIVA